MLKSGRFSYRRNTSVNLSGFFFRLPCGCKVRIKSWDLNSPLLKRLILCGLMCVQPVWCNAVLESGIFSRPACGGCKPWKKSTMKQLMSRRLWALNGSTMDVCKVWIKYIWDVHCFILMSSHYIDMLPCVGYLNSKWIVNHIHADRTGHRRIRLSDTSTKFSMVVFCPGLDSLPVLSFPLASASSLPHFLPPLPSSFPFLAGLVCRSFRAGMGIQTGIFLEDCRCLF